MKELKAIQNEVLELIDKLTDREQELKKQRSSVNRQIYNLERTYMLAARHARTLEKAGKDYTEALNSIRATIATAGAMIQN